MTTADQCFHCGAALRGPPTAVMVVGGQPVGFCGPACHEIARRIVGDGLEGFYRFRSGPVSPSGAPAEAAGWATYDRPALQREFVTERSDGSREAQLLVQGVRCAACSWLIERAMAGVPGVREIAVDPMTTRTRLSWDPARASLSALLARIAALGYDPFPYTSDASDRAATVERNQALRQLVVAGFGMSAVMSYATAIYLGATQGMDAQTAHFLRLVSLLVATPVVFYSATPFYAGAWRGLRNLHPGMDLPVALAIAASYAASVWNTFRNTGEVYFDSAVMFVFFLSAARFLEMSGRHRASGLTGALARHLPRVATRLVAGRGEAVAVAELAPGDLVLVQPGQSFPVDGLLESDAARVDESLLTGESRPLRRARGERVVAGSINLLAAATVRVERTGAGTVLAQISQLITSARAERPRLVQLADRVGAWFVTAVLVLAALVGLAWWNIQPERAFEVVLAVLVVTCPCALALATPAAFTVGMSAMARQGVLLRRAGALEALSRVTDMVFDKTGTLTEHAAGIQHVESLDGSDPQAALAVAAALESRSEHPLARAFPKPAAAVDVTEMRAVPGQGIEGRVDGEQLRIGSREFALGLSAASVDSSAAGTEQELLSVYLGDARGLRARFEIAEQLRSGTAEALQALAAEGVTVSIASGDQPGPVRAVARRLGIDSFSARLQPPDKLALVRGLQQQGRTVAMVGDGINDSPVLAGADVSIAIGSGTSLAQHSADCVLVGAGLGALPRAVALARRSMRVVRQNLAWALAYNAIAVPLAALGLLAPWVAAIGMSASSLLVTFNALRLGRLPTPSPAATAAAAASADAGAVTP